MTTQQLLMIWTFGALAFLVWAYANVDAMLSGAFANPAVAADERTRRAAVLMLGLMVVCLAAAWPVSTPVIFAIRAKLRRRP